MKMVTTILIKATASIARRNALGSCRTTGWDEPSCLAIEARPSTWASPCRPSAWCRAETCLPWSGDSVEVLTRSKTPQPSRYYFRVASRAFLSDSPCLRQFSAPGLSFNIARFVAWPRANHHRASSGHCFPCHAGSMIGRGWTAMLFYYLLSRSASQRHAPTVRR